MSGNYCPCSACVPHFAWHLCRRCANLLPLLHLFSNSLFLCSLITKIDEESLQFGTYQKLIKLLDNYNPDVTVEEAPTSEELQEEQEFLDEMFQTEIIQTSFNFLKSFNYVSDLEEYRNKIYKLWFELYDRDGTSKNVLGSR